MWVGLCVLVVPDSEAELTLATGLKLSVISVYTDDYCTFSIRNLDYYNNRIGSNIRTFLTILY